MLRGAWHLQGQGQQLSAHSHISNCRWAPLGAVSVLGTEEPPTQSHPRGIVRAQAEMGPSTCRAQEWGGRRRRKVSQDAQQWGGMGESLLHVWGQLFPHSTLPVSLCPHPANRPVSALCSWSFIAPSRPPFHLEQCRQVQSSLLESWSSPPSLCIQLAVPGPLHRKPQCSHIDDKALQASCP